VVRPRRRGGRPRATSPCALAARRRARHGGGG
jgi:hypothetical protein